MVERELRPLAGDEVLRAVAVTPAQECRSGGADLLGRADAALYRAKQDGRNRIVGGPVRVT